MSGPPMDGDLKLMAHAQLILALLRRTGPVSFTAAELAAPGGLAVSVGTDGRICFAAEETLVAPRLAETDDEQHDG